ncbi:MAG: acyloxyacyl hydrolase [Desulfobacterales bacterium]
MALLENFNAVSILIRFRIVIIFVFLVTLFFSHALSSEEEPVDQGQKWLSDIRLGILAHDVPIWSRSRAEGGVGFNTEFIFVWPNCELWTGIVRSNLGITLNSQGDTSKIYSGFLWERLWPSGLFLNLGLGLAAHDGKIETNDDNRKELGSRILFRIPVEIGLLFTEHHGLSIMFDHVSNAYLAEPNEGLDNLGIRYTYRF